MIKKRYAIKQLVFINLIGIRDIYIYIYDTYIFNDY